MPSRQTKNNNQPRITNYFSPVGQKILTVYNNDGTQYRFIFDENWTLGDVQNAFRENDNRDFIISSVDDFNKPIKELPNDFQIDLFPYKANVTFRFVNVYDGLNTQRAEILYQTSKEMDLQNLNGNILEEVAKRIWSELTSRQKKYKTTFFREVRIAVNSKYLRDMSINFIDLPNVKTTENNIIKMDVVVSNIYPQEVNNNIEVNDNNVDYFNPAENGYEYINGVWMKKGGKKSKRRTRQKRKSKKSRRLY